MSKSAKNYFTVAELQSICRSLNLERDGIKHELVERIAAYLKNVESSDTEYTDADEPLPIARMVINQDIIPLPSTSMEIPLPQPAELQAKPSSLNSTLWQWFPLAISGVIIVISALNFLFGWSTEYIAVPVKRSWFG